MTRGLHTYKRQKNRAEKPHGSTPKQNLPNLWPKESQRAGEDVPQSLQQTRVYKPEVCPCIGQTNGIL